MDPMTVPPADPPTLASFGGATQTNAPQSIPTKASAAAPIKTAPLPQSGANIPTSAGGSIVEPPKPVAPVAPPPPPLPTLPTDHPSTVMTTNTSPSSSKFNLFISVLIGVVVLIWMGVGFIYFSNQQLKTDTTASTGISQEA